MTIYTGLVHCRPVGALGICYYIPMEAEAWAPEEAAAQLRQRAYDTGHEHVSHVKDVTVKGVPYVQPKAISLSALQKIMDTGVSQEFKAFRSAADEERFTSLWPSLRAAPTRFGTIIVSKI